MTSSSSSMDSTRDPASQTLVDEKNFKYLSDVDPEERGHHSLFYSSRSNLRKNLLLAATFLTLLGTIIYLTLTRQPIPKMRYDQCGTSSDEARARGCIFEVTGFAWLPPACADPATEQDFLNYITHHDLKYYRDTNYTELVPLSEVRLGNGPGFYVTEKYHLTHCLFLLQKLHKAVARGAPVDGQILPTHHTEHCAGQVLQGLRDPDFRMGEVQISYTKFPYCGRKGGWNVVWPERRLDWADW